METLKNILDTYNWLNEAFVHQTEETTEQDTLDSFSLKNRIIYYKTNDHEPISKWYNEDKEYKSDIPELIESNTYDEKSDTGMLLFKEPVTSIGEYAFYYCLSLTSITIPKSVTSIERCAFTLCIKLETVTIPDDVKSIGDVAFNDCESLETVFYKGKEYRDRPSILNALGNNNVELGRSIFNRTKLSEN